MFRVAIVDDEAAERAQIRKCLDYVEQMRQVSFDTQEFAATENFLMHYNGDFDLVLMDILFENGKDGMEAAKSLRKLDKTVPLVFVTNMAQLAIAGYAVDALDFILKPVQPQAFLLKMIRILGRMEQHNGKSILLKSQGEGVRLPVRNIRYLLVQGHYVEYHTRDGVFSQYCTLATAEKELDSPEFFRCDRGCLVNLRLVSQVTKEFCMVDGETLPIARSQRTAFLRALSGYLGGEKTLEGNNNGLF